jgi:hypothetical protein
MTTIEVSVVMPCLNEAETIVACIQKAYTGLRTAGVQGEVVISDNGSSDGSQQLAQSAGARVIAVEERGYGAALRAGISAARGRYVIMGDADDSYDFSRLSGIVEKLHEGFQLVMGNRFKGGIRHGAMPFLHRYLGNPVLSFLGRLFFRTHIGDFHCGLRGFERTAILQLRLRTSGMEFASEMVVKAALAGLRIAEVPTTLSPDGRSRAPHLRTWRDGWRHLRFLLTLSPRWLFLYPGLALFTLGVSLQGILLQGSFTVGNLALDIHTMLYAAAMSIIGAQMVWFAVFTKIYGATLGLMPKDSRIEYALGALTLERGLVLGVTLLLGGLILSATALSEWARHNYGALNPRDVMRVAIPAVSMMIVGMEFVFSSFFVSILRMGHQDIVKPNGPAERSIAEPISPDLIL